MDCSGAYHNQGCNGGWPYQAFKYIQGVGGIETEKEYPYVAHVSAVWCASGASGAHGAHGASDVSVVVVMLAMLMMLLVLVGY